MNDEAMMQLATHFSDCHRRWRAALDEALSKIMPEVTRTQWHIITKFLCKGPCMTQQACAEYLLMDPAQLARELKKMEDKGLIKRTVDPTDRRSRQLTLGKASRPYVSVLTECSHQVNQDICAALTDSEKIMFSNLLEKMNISVLCEE